MFKSFFKVFSFLSLFLCFYCPLFAKSSEGHNKDLGYIIYEIIEYNKFETEASKDELLSYWIVSDATSFAIDENGMGKTKYKYQSLQDNLKSTTKGKSLILPPYSEFISTGGGNHRAYNHQGFYWDYRDKYDNNGENKYLERWILGRDKILIPSTAVAFNLSIESPEAEAISVVAYYCHILGDLIEGKADQMGAISTYYYMLLQLESDLKDALIKVGGDVLFTYNEKIRNGVFRKIRFSVRSCKSKDAAYEKIKEFMRNEMTTIIEKLVGTNISDIQILN